MNMKDKLIGAGLVLLAFGPLGSAAASASSSTPPAVRAETTVKKAVAPEPVSATDKDTTQSGDQTTPDVPGATETLDPNEKPDVNEAPGTEKPDAKEAPGTEKPDVNEAPGTETKDAIETGSDGPGGHADPLGQVDNQQDAKN